MLEKLEQFSFNHSDQIDRLYEVMTTADMKAAFDSRGEEVRITLNKLVDDLQAEIGASNIGMTPIAELGTQNKVNDIINRIIEILKSTADGFSGADFISATNITGLEGTTVQALLESLKKFIDDYKLELNSNAGASKIKTTNGKTVQEEINRVEGLANGAVTTSNQAKSIAETANNRVNNIISGTPANKDAELVDMRYDALNNKTYPTAGKRVDDITSQLAQNVQQISGVNTKVNEMEFVYGIEIAKQTLSDAMRSKIKNKILFPDGFTWTDAPINIYKSALGEITTNFEASNYQVTGKTYYVNRTGGSALNDGLTPETALTRLNAARAKEDVKVIIVASGWYDTDYGFNNSVSVNKDITIKAAEGADVTITTSKQVTWTKTNGYTNVYQASRTLVSAIYDKSIIDEFGDYTKLIQKSSIAEVDATPGSYYYVSPDLYVNTPNSRVADADILVFLDTVNLYNVGNFRTYVEGIKFYGGNQGCVAIGANTSTDNPLFVAKNCEFKYSSAGNGGIQSTGADCYLQDCVTSRNALDGNNYHKGNNRIPKAIEVSCISRRNGIGRGSDSDNATTMHDGGKIIRVNGIYHNCEGPNVADIDIGTESWNVGCESNTSVCTKNNRNNYYIGNGGIMWLDSCIGYNSQYSYKAGSGTLYAKNTLFDDAPAYSGIVIPY